MKKLVCALLFVGVLIGGAGCIVPYGHHDSYGYGYDHGYYNHGHYSHHHYYNHCPPGGGGLRVNRH